VNIDISIAKRGTNLEIKPLKLRHKLRPKDFINLAHQTLFNSWYFVDMCGLPLVKLVVADHKDGHDVKFQN
jgi:hypothetical protein